MRLSSKSLIFLAAVLFQAAAPALPLWAEVKADLKAFKVLKDDKGKESLAPADQAKPGDIIEYQAVYTNQGASAVKDLKAMVPIPAGTEYMPRTANPARVEASADGQSYGLVPLKRSVRRPDGKTEVQDVPYGEYLSLRWGFPELASGQSVAVKARARINTQPVLVPQSKVKEGEKDKKKR